ncbi:MAG: damage-control phosphatase ARMT1 family protein [Anaerolineales bacterium]
MKTYLDCYPCFLRQALEASRAVGITQEGQHHLLQKVMEELLQLDTDCPPPEIAQVIHRMVRMQTGAHDPYSHLKAHSTKRALNLYPRLQRLLQEADDPLSCAVRLAIAGNIIDFAQPNTKARVDNLWSAVQDTLRQPFTIDHTQALGKALEASHEVLFLADNAGETVFDRLLIESIETPTRYVVKGGPIINDATVKDAQKAELHRVAEIINSGSDAPGTLLKDCSPTFLHDFYNAPVIIAKGQANYETLSQVPAPIFFLLKIKCPVIAKDMGVATGSIICKRSENYLKRSETVQPNCR